ncbi:MAG: glutamine--fructose-6-phosphate transaminase (isomerizing) [Oscillospiraceae bacterium]|nr:glutamine--fructose-6-phosphate transaminase (isomerizing) [Oscillospiraceae bacterium]
MCGIVGYIGDKEVVPVLTDGLRMLEYRGYDSAGVAVCDGSQIRTVKAKGRLDDLETRLKEEGTPRGICGIGHTRWATHGAPSDVNSHPHSNGRIAIVHNGIIENYLSIKEKRSRDGYTFLSETDTETILAELNRQYDGDPIAALRETVFRLKGSYALGVLFADFPDRIYAIRKDSPLIVGLGKGENFIASDIPAILRHTNQYILPDENEIIVVEKESVAVMDLEGNRKEKPVLTAAFDVEAAEKGGYPHFMLKEIHQEPEAVTATVHPRVKEGLPCLAEEGLTDEILKGTKRIHIVACGTAMHAGMAAQNAIEEFARTPVNVEIASEFRYKDPIIEEGDMVCIISQSGETADTLAALRLAKERGAFVLAVVNVVGSSIAREADCVLYTRAGPEIAVASTKAYTVQVSLLYLVALRLGLVKGGLTEERTRELTGWLLKVPQLLETMLEDTQPVNHLAGLYQNTHDLFFIGRGLDYSLSMEGSLKLKEISYIHSEAYAAGELKHGTISLITDGIPVIAVATQEKLFEKMISNVKEVKARGASVILICREGTEVPAEVADHCLPISAELPASLAAIPAVLLLQLFAYYTAVLRGCDVDKPRNLAKSVTVE